METERVAEIFIDGQWQPTELEHLLKGDTFRLTDPEGPVAMPNGQTIFVCAGNAHFNQLHQQWVVSVEDESVIEGETDGNGMGIF
ncbi:MAG: hypothetical protein NTW30_05080 [Candidatus Aenigmarchaeota archaeon]|nr:hypothetical protein [Candidatus Aenigmarchaeota archaeon]